MSDIVANVKKKQQTIQKMISDQAEQKGSHAQLLKQLSEEHDVKSLKEAEKVLEEFIAEKKKNEEALTEVVAELAGIISEATSSD